MIEGWNLAGLGVAETLRVWSIGCPERRGEFEFIMLWECSY